MKYLFPIIALSLLCFSICGEGFVEGTLVKTVKGYTEIQKLKIGDFVLSCDFQKHCIERRVTNTLKIEDTSYFEVQLKNSKIIYAREQAFYDPKLKNWVAVPSWTESQSLMNDKYKTVTSQRVGFVQGKITLYLLTIDQNSNFFVSRDDILVHNFMGLVGANR